MPLPIWPAPTTPTFLILTAIVVPAPTPSLFYDEPRLCANARSSRLSFLGELVAEFGKRLEQIGDEAVIGDLENRRFLILVDGDDHFRILHAGEMLDRAGNADGKIKLGRHHFAGLADLPVVRRIAGIDRGARGADRGPELVGDGLDVFREVFLASKRPAAGDDDARRGQFRAVRFRKLFADEARNAGIVGGTRGLDRRVAAGAHCL